MAKKFEGVEFVEPEEVPVAAEGIGIVCPVDTPTTNQPQSVSLQKPETQSQVSLQKQVAAPSGNVRVVPPGARPASERLISRELKPMDKCIGADFRAGVDGGLFRRIYRKGE